MPIEFDQVSYTYVDPKSRKRRERKMFGKKHGSSEAAGDDGRTASDKWGSAPEAVWVLHGLSFTVEDGEFFGIAGHTGSGKSTLVQHMNGLVHPSEGRVLFDGRDLADKGNANYARGKCGVVFQYPEHQLFAVSAYEDAAFGPRNLGFPEEKVEKLVRRAFAQVDLSFDELAEKSPFELSGGQQRRLAFAGVLAMEPEVLVLDEPVAGLDPKARAEFLELIGRLHEGGLTVVMVSHCMDDLARFCDRVLVLKEGERLLLGSPAEVFADPELLKSVGLGVPAAQSFALRLREKGFALPRELYDAGSLADDLAGCLAVGVAGGADAEGAAGDRGAQTDSDGASAEGAARAEDVAGVAHAEDAK